jgi:hypothetical protein
MHLSYRHLLDVVVVVSITNNIIQIYNTTINKPVVVLVHDHRWSNLLVCQLLFLQFQHHCYRVSDKRTTNKELTQK